MNIHEYQAKRLLEKYGVNVLKGGVAHTPQEAEAVAKDLAGPVWVVKAQIHAGGRGKGAFIEKSAGPKKRSSDIGCDTSHFPDSSNR